MLVPNYRCIFVEGVGGAGGFGVVWGGLLSRPFPDLLRVLLGQFDDNLLGDGLFGIVLKV